MSQEDDMLFQKQFEEVIDPEIEGLLKDDAYYQKLATPLKSAKLVKEEHRQQLKEIFKLSVLREELNRAQKLMLELLPNFLPPEEFAQVKKESDESSQHFVQFIEKINANEEREKPILLQEMFGFSDSTLLHTYALASDLVKKGNIADAYSLFVFLATMAPYVASYWVAQGVSLKALGRVEEAIPIFETAILLDPKDPLSRAHMIESLIAMKERDRARSEYDALKDVIKGLSSEEKRMWEQRISNFRIP